MTSVGLDVLAQRLNSIVGIRKWGSVTQVIGDLIEADTPGVTLGAFAQIGDCVCDILFIWFLDEGGSYNECN